MLGSLPGYPKVEAQAWPPASGKGSIFQEYPVPQALPASGLEGNCNYLSLALNLFSKDPVNNKAN